jgi:hypothetical protein
MCIPDNKRSHFPKTTYFEISVYMKGTLVVWGDWGHMAKYRLDWPGLTGLDWSGLDWSELDWNGLKMD